MTPIARLLSLRVDLRDEAAAAEVTPEALAAYCVARGWAFALSTPALDVHRRDATSLAKIHVPRDPSADGYGRRVREAIDRLAEHEGRSPLAVWADLVGLRDPAAEVVTELDAQLASMTVRPRMYGSTSEAVLFQALLAMELRARLLGEPDPREAYEALLRERWGAAALHACSHLGLDRIGAFVADLVERVTGRRLEGAPERTRADADCRAGEGPSRGDRTEALPLPHPEPAQGVLPGVPAPTRPRRRAVHRWGVIAPETLPPDPLDPERPHEGQVERCPHCRALRRRANTGPRLGAQLMYSRDGREWSYANPVCVMKE